MAQITINESLEQEVFVFPATIAQTGIWLYEKKIKEKSPYHIGFQMDIVGDFDITAAKKAITYLIGRHEILRTSFKFIDNKLLQIVHNEVSIDIPAYKIENVLNIEDFKKKLTEKAYYTSFDLENEVAWRIEIQQIFSNKFLLVLTIHHIICDAWSVQVFLKEFVEIYEQIHMNQHVVCSDLKYQYGDYALLEENWLKTKECELAFKYWENYLKDIKNYENIFLDREMIYNKSLEYEQYKFSLPHNIHALINSFLKKENYTMFMALLSAYVAFLSIYFSTPNVLVAIPSVKRKTLDLENTLGVFVNLIIYNKNISNNTTFFDLIKDVKEWTLESYEYSLYPFEKLVDELAIPRNRGKIPLIQTMFMYQNVPINITSPPTINIKMNELYSGSSKYDLSLSMNTHNGEIHGIFDYNLALFSFDEIHNIVKIFQNLLLHVYTNLNQKINTLELLSIYEQKQFGHLWNVLSESKNPNYEGQKQLKVLDAFESFVKKKLCILALYSLKVNYTHM